MKIIKKIYNWLMPPQNVPPPTRTIAQILSDLNQSGSWAQIPDYFSITTPTIKGKDINFSLPSKGIVLVAFLNIGTGEVRTFVAKYLDTPIRNDLF